MPGKLWPTLFGEKKVIKYIWRSTWLEPKPAVAAGSLFFIGILLAVIIIGAFSFQNQPAETPVPSFVIEGAVEIAEVENAEKLSPTNLEQAMQPDQAAQEKSFPPAFKNAPPSPELGENEIVLPVFKNKPENSSIIEARILPEKNEKIRNLLNIVPLTEFGWQYNKTHQDWRLHPGVDLSADEPKIPAVTGGMVEDVFVDRNFGLTVIVATDRYKIYYASLSSTSLKKNEQISTGDTVGFSGISEGETKPHLHLGVKSIATGKYLNPLEVLAK